MNLVRFIFASATLTLAAPGPVLANTILLQPGQQTQFTIPGNCTIKDNIPAPCFTNDLAIDVPASARQLRIEVDGGDADVDLLVRYGQAFPVSGNLGEFGGINWLLEHAHYQSISETGQEVITITRRQHQPLRAGRWHLSIQNWSNRSSAVTVQAQLSEADPGPVPITVDFDDEQTCSDRQATTAPWNDTTAASPAGGNPGTTIGQQRRNAFLHAMARVSEQLPGTGPVRILACWRALGHADGDVNRATLASAGPRYLVRNDSYRSAHGYSQPFLDKDHTWYSAAASAQRAGNGLCRHAGVSCDEQDIFIQFNTDVDGTVTLGERRFHYGYEPQSGGNQNLDFIATAMHEIAHGLGFVGLLDLDDDNLGAKFQGYDDIYSDAAVFTPPNAPVMPLNRLPQEQRAQALTSITNLRWADPEAVAASGNPWLDREFPDNLPRLHAPNPVVGGSSFSHLNDFRQPNQLMSPFIINGLRTLGLARQMLAAVGWQVRDQAAPTYSRPYGGNWFDPAWDGHGIDLHRVEGLPDTYILVFYTFDANGLPEWYLSIGRIIDGVFRPGDDSSGNGLLDASSLVRPIYQSGATPPQVLDASIRGQIRIDFNQAERAPECNDGVGRNAPLALMSFSITPRGQTEEHLRWCMTQIVPEAARPEFDRSGHWYAGDNDSGWGLTTLGFGDDGDGLFAVLYYPDNEGKPRWAGLQSLDFTSGDTQPLLQAQGYCRTCSAPASGITYTPVGELRLELEPPQGSPGTLEFEVEFNGPEGGRFERGSLPLQLLGQSAPTGD